MNESPQERAVAYLLGELDPPDASEFERRLAADASLREEVERLEPVVRELRELPREGWSAEELPRLELPVAGLPRTVRPESPGGWRARFTPRRVAIAGAASLAVFAGGILLGTQLADESEPAPATVSLELRPLAGAEGDATGAVELTGAGTRDAELVVDGLPPSAAGTYYELWLLRDDETVSLGSFTVGADGHADTAISIPVDPGSYDAFDVSVEREDGNPAHSGESVLRGSTAPS